MDWLTPVLYIVGALLTGGCGVKIIDWLRSRKTDVEYIRSHYRDMAEDADEHHKAESLRYQGEINRLIVVIEDSERRIERFRDRNIQIEQELEDAKAQCAKYVAELMKLNGPLK